MEIEQLWTFSIEIEVIMEFFSRIIAKNKFFFNFSMCDVSNFSAFFRNLLKNFAKRSYMICVFGNSCVVSLQDGWKISGI